MGARAGGLGRRRARDAGRRRSGTGMHSGVGGLAHVLTEIGLVPPVDDRRAGRSPTGSPPGCGPGSRPRPSRTTSTAWSATSACSSLWVRTADRCRRGRRPTQRARGRRRLADRLPQATRLPARWPGQRRHARHRERPARCRLGDAARRTRRPRARRPAADVLLAEAERGSDRAQLAVRAAAVPRHPRRTRCPTGRTALPASRAALALAGPELDRPDLVDAARGGAEHLVTLGDTSDDGFRVPAAGARGRRRPTPRSSPTAGATAPSGTSLSFPALALAGVDELAGERAPATWERRCLHSVRSSGLPERLRPGLLGQRRPLLRHGRRGRGVPRRLAAVRRPRRPGVRHAPGRHARRPGLPRRPARLVAVPRAPRARAAAPARRRAGCRAPPGSRRTSSAPRGSSATAADAAAVARMDNWWTLPPRPGA